MSDTINISDSENEYENEYENEHENEYENEYENENENEYENEIEMGESENEELPTVIDFSIDNILPRNVTWTSHNRMNSIFSLIYGGLNNQQNNVYDPLNEVISNSFDEDKDAYKNVLSEKGKQQLKIINYNSTISKEKRCPITQEEFEENQEIIQLPCSHIFSKEAITKWLETESAKCPICRIELESKEIKREEETNDTRQIPLITPRPTPGPRPITSFRNTLLQIIQEEQDRREEEYIQQALLNSFTPQTPITDISNTE